MDFKCDTTLLRDELSDTKLHRYLTDMAQSSSKRFKKIKDRGGPTYTILPPLNYQEDTTLPNNTAMVDRRKLVKLEEKAAKLDQAVADNQRMVAELEELQTQVKALSSELSAKAAACSDEDPVTGDAVHKYSTCSGSNRSQRRCFAAAAAACHSHGYHRCRCERHPFTPLSWW